MTIFELTAYRNISVSTYLPMFVLRKVFSYLQDQTKALVWILLMKFCAIPVFNSKFSSQNVLKVSTAVPKSIC